ncbi:MAG TPA: hypothetical protein V6C63_14145, partial [Allocoleopsis sp.]
VVQVGSEKMANREELAVKSIQTMNAEQAKQNWILQKTQIHKAATVGLAVVSALIMSGCQVGNSAIEINPLAAAIFLLVFSVWAGLVLRFMVNTFVENSTPFRARRQWNNNGDAGGGGYSGWNWDDFSGYDSDSSGGDSGCGDSGSSDGGDCSSGGE